MIRRTLPCFKSLFYLVALLLTVPASAQQVVIGATSGSSDYFYGPYYRSSSGSSFNYSNYAYLYTASELGIPSGSVITQVEWLKENNGTITGNNTFNIWLENTASSSLSATNWGNVIASATQVYASTTQSFTATANMYESFTLSTPFVYNGGNLKIATEHVKSGTATDANYFYINSATGMAIGVANSSPTTSGTTLDNGYGDYRPTIRITYTPGTPCSGAPTAGTASAPASVCSNTPFTLSLSGYTIGSDLTFQWEQSPAGANTWSNVPGATNPISTLPGITSPTDFRLLITCTNGGLTDYSNTVTVNISPFINCYCPSGATNDGDGEILNVTMGNVNNSSSCPGVAPSYADYTTTVTAIQLMQGTSMPFSVSAGSCGSAYPGAVKIFIDYNQNGDFSDPGEEAYFEDGFNYQPAPGYLVSGTISVPATATAGQTRMRVIMEENGSSSTSPCGYFGYGETEDYLVDILPSVACSSNPVAGTASGPASVCANSPFDLQLNGYTQATGLTIQWEQSPAGANTWTSVAGGTSALATIPGITADMDFRAVVTCTNGGLSDISGVITVAVSPFYLCYCGPNTGVTLNDFATDELTGVEIVSTTLNNPTNTVSPLGYTLFWPTTTNTTADLVQTVTYTLNTDHLYGSMYSDAWIDFDQSGTFDASEFVDLVTSGNSATGSFTVPATAVPGLTGLRVRYYWTDYLASEACEPFYDYETEDYVVNIVAAAACSGPPVAGTASGPSSICAGVPFTLSVTGQTVGTGIVLQWQESPTGANTWSNITGATNVTYVVNNQTAATDYRLLITCTNGGLTDISNVVAVSQNLASQCYCTPQWVTACNDGDDINDFTLTGENGTSFNDLATGCSTGGYDDRTAQPAVQLAQGLTYNGDMSSNYGSLEFARIWVDFGDDGVFDATDEVGTASNILDVLTPYSITIPSTATLGTHRMRVRLAYNQTPGSIDPCTSYDYGEVHDYTVTIIPPPACMAPTGLAGVGASGTTATVSWNAVTGAAGYEYVVDQNSTSPTGAGTPVSGTTATVTGLTTPNTYYLHVRTDCGAAGYSSWTTISFIMQDGAGGAIPLVVGAGCTGNIYSNVNASQSPGEPYPNCNDYSTGHHTVWFSFSAPASGAVRVTTDIAPAGTNQDTKIALFSATNVNDYNTFTIISCDEDGGNTINYNSTLYATGLTSGQTYYVQVDGWSTSDVGTFCIAVDELTSSMLPAGPLSCDDIATPVAGNTSYTGWVPLLTTTGHLVALVRNPAGGAGADYEGSVTVETGAPRQAPAGLFYLNRNYHIINSTVSTPVDVQFFFTDAELTALQGADATATLSNLNVTKQTGATCTEDYLPASGTNSLLPQTASGSVNGVSWVQAQTSSFSNFFINAGNSPLTIQLLSIKAENAGARNQVIWQTASEQAGDKFELERSTDGNSFRQLEVLSATGRPGVYTYWDESPVAGTNYYRLKLVNRDGSYFYSEVVEATVTGAFTVNAYPNPVDQILHIAVTGRADNATVSLTDVTGKVIRTIAIEEDKTQISMSGLAQGVYFIRYADDARSETIKVNKQ